MELLCLLKTNTHSGLVAGLLVALYFSWQITVSTFDYF